MNTHPLIAALERDLDAVGVRHSKRIHKRLAVIVQTMANLLGVTVSLSQGMGAYSVAAEGAVFTYEGEEDTPGQLKAHDCLLDYIGEGYSSISHASYTLDRMTPYGEELLAEAAELVRYLSDAPHCPIEDITCEPKA